MWKPEAGVDEEFATVNFAKYKNNISTHITIINIQPKLAETDVKSIQLDQP